MAKTTTCVTIDTDLIEKAKRHNINISGSMNELLHTMLAKKEGDVDGINIELERIKKGKLLKQLQEMHADLKVTEMKIEEYEKNLSEKVEKDLKEEKERIESSKKCINCGKQLIEDSDKKEFKSGFVCRVCFLGSNTADIKIWNTVKKRCENGDRGGSV